MGIIYRNGYMLVVSDLKVPSLLQMKVFILRVKHKHFCILF